VRKAGLPILAVVLGLAAGAILMVTVGTNPGDGYRALLEGAFGGGAELGRTLDKATPLIFTGLAVAFAFKAGLFNIGAQGQLLLGAAFGAWVGYAFGLPGWIHIPFSLVLGALTAALLGALVGVLKAVRGAHEVITTIMFNFVAANLTDWLVSRDGPWTDATGGAIARTPRVADSAVIPRMGDIPVGFFIAAGAAIIVWALLARTTLGFAIRTVGFNRDAATYAGISVVRITVLAMAASAFLAGLGGAVETLGVDGRFQPGFNVGLGFDGITIALLARTNALAVIPAAFLLGALDAGSSLMQARTEVEPEIISLIQAFILFFVAAPLVVRWLLRLRKAPHVEEPEHPKLSTGWGR
jgi:simple sugar transport system permease protein